MHYVKHHAQLDQKSCFLHEILRKSTLISRLCGTRQDSQSIARSTQGSPTLTQHVLKLSPSPALLLVTGANSARPTMDPAYTVLHPAEKCQPRERLAQPLATLTSYGGLWSRRNGLGSTPNAFGELPATHNPLRALKAPAAQSLLSVSRSCPAVLGNRWITDHCPACEHLRSDESRSSPPRRSKPFSRTQHAALAPTHSGAKYKTSRPRSCAHLPVALSFFFCSAHAFWTFLRTAFMISA